MPNEFFVGWQRVFVFIDGLPARGILRVTREGGASFEKTLGVEGSVNVFFDHAGNWVLEFEAARKRVRVRERALEQLSGWESAGSTSGGGGAGGAATGFAVALPAPEWIALALAFVAALAALAWWLHSRPRFAKSFDGKRVKLQIECRRGELRNLLLTDYTPDEADARDFSEEPSISETIYGRTLKWKRDSLRPGEKWVVEYSMRVAPVTELDPADLQAVDAKGRQVRLHAKLE